MRSKTLEHIRVLDLTRVLAGPWCTQNLADLGADVIKIERPGSGDDTRGWGPPFLIDHNGQPTKESAYYLACNRGKRSITLDITQPEAQEIVRRLAVHSDVVVENYKVGTLARYGLAYEDLRKIRPDIIYCSISGYGQNGPMADQPGYDFIFQGMTGLMSVNGDPKNENSPGQRVGVPVSDLITGMYSTVAILAALAYRSISGTGQYIDMALLDSTIALLSIPNMNYLLSGIIPARVGNAHANIVPYQTFECENGHIVLAVGNDSQFANFCNAIEAPALKNDERYRTNAMRLANRASLVEVLAPIMKRRKVADWIAILDRVNVPSGPINDIRQMFAEPQVVARGIRVDIAHPLANILPVVASPIRLSETPVQYGDCAPPLLGEHTQQVLASLANVDDATLQDFASRGII